MSRYVNRRTVLGALALVLLGIFLPPLVNVNRFRPRIAGALSRALGRPVTLEGVTLRLLPTPGLNLSGLVVQDDPAFSAEPILRANEVTAAMRLTSLWRGRLEIASLSLAYPSMNLVRRPDGHWNVEALLERARQIPAAPTAKRRPEARPRFPYIEANEGRINLKLGNEKTVYALSEADFALWLASENEWRLRLAARPVRTDANLSDTGIVKVNGAFQRGSSLSDTPLTFAVTLQAAQLGQLTTLIYGRDRGWRGTANVTATLTGTPADLKIAGDASVDDFRRYDIASAASMNLSAHCSANFSTTEQQVRGIDCHAPVGSGAIDVRGYMAGVLPPREAIFSVVAAQVPADSLSTLARHMKKDLPADLSARGFVNAAFELRRDGAGQTAWAGSGSTSVLELRSRSLEQPLSFGPVLFAAGPQKTAVTNLRVPLAPLPADSLRVLAFDVDLGAGIPAKAEAQFSRSEYNVSLNGQGDIPRLLDVAEALGIAAPPITATGVAKLDVKVAGTWAGFSQPLVTGTAQVRASASVPGIYAPVATSASLTFDPQAITARNLTISIPATHVLMTGSLSLPRRCIGTGQCSVTFQLASDALSAEDLNRLLNPNLQKRPWYQLLGPGGQPNVLKMVRAHGKITVDRFAMQSLAANRISGDVDLERGVLTVRNLQAGVFGGVGTGDVRADFTGAQPVYSTHGRLVAGSVAALASLTNDAWGTGRVDATFSLTTSGATASDLRSSATGTAEFDWRDGSFARVSLNGDTSALRIRRFQGTVSLRDGVLKFSPSKMETPAGIYIVSGTASLDRQLALVLARGKTPAFEINGTLSKPRIAPSAAPPTQAALKQ